MVQCLNHCQIQCGGQMMVWGEESAVWSAINHIASCNENSHLVSVMHCMHWGGTLTGCIIRCSSEIDWTSVQSQRQL